MNIVSPDQNALSSKQEEWPIQPKLAVLYMSVPFLLATLPMMLDDGNAEGVVTFRSGQLTEVWDFGNGRSHMGGHVGYSLRFCVDPQYYCVVGITAILAPRGCK